jgi:hypothetical protein
VPTPVVDVLARGLAGDAGRRYPTVEAFAAAFRQAMDAGADALVAGVYDAFAVRDQVMAKLLIDGALRLRPNHPQAALVRDQLQSGPTSLAYGLAPGVPAPLDGPVAALPMGFDMPLPPPVPSTSSRSNPWMTFGIAVALGTILLIVAVVLVFIFAGQ